MQNLLPIKVFVFELNHLGHQSLIREIILEPCKRNLHCFHWMQMVLLLQTEITSKIEVESKITAVTETQLDMLVQVILPSLPCHRLDLYVCTMIHHPMNRTVLHSLNTTDNNSIHQRSDV